MTTSVKDLRRWYKKGQLRYIARAVPRIRYRKNAFVQFLMESDLLRMHAHINDRPLTLGADPEFILCEKGNEDKIVLFSSQYATDYFGISEAEIGADYGLLEFRPDPVENPKEMVDSIMDLHKRFEERYTDFQILEKEAIEYNHKRARVLESITEGKEINYGMNRGKDVGVWSPNAEITLGMENGMSLSAYDRPMFCQFDDKLFTAGGHIHIGGSLIMMRSLPQLKELVQKLDERVLPICNSVETPAGEIRRAVYGSPGEFRLKEYGIEYRSPSNAIFWKKNSKPLLKALRTVKRVVMEVV